MKSKNLIQAGLTAIAFTTLSQLAFAGGGTEGGGRTINLNDHPALRDLYDKTNCSYVELPDFLADQSQFAGADQFKAVLKVVDQIHWYLRFNLERETKHLVVCETYSPLIKIPAEDSDSVSLATDDETENGNQVGIRMNEKIFLDMTVFNRESPLDQAYTILHEVMHSFIPMNTDRRNNKLRSVIASIRQEQIAPKPFKWFALQMRMNSLTVPADTTLVTDPELKQDFATAFSTTDVTSMDRYVAAGRLSKAAPALMDADQKALDALIDRGYDALLKYVRADDLANTKTLLKASYRPQGKFFSIRDLFTADDSGYSKKPVELPYRATQGHGFGDTGTILYYETHSTAQHEVKAPFVERPGTQGRNLYMLLPTDEDRYGDDRDTRKSLLVRPVLYGQLKMVQLLLQYAGDEDSGATWINRDDFQIDAYDPRTRKNNGFTCPQCSRDSRKASSNLAGIADFLGYPSIVQALLKAGSAPAAFPILDDHD